MKSTVISSPHAAIVLVSDNTSEAFLLGQLAERVPQHETRQTSDGRIELTLLLASVVAVLLRARLPLICLLCLCLGGCAESETTPARAWTDVADLAVRFFGTAALVWAFAKWRRD